MNKYDDKFLVVGGHQLNGSISVQTSKNAVLPILAGCILTEKSTIKNVPNILDVKSMVNILQQLGVKIDCKDKDYYIDSSSMTSHILEQEACKALRSSIFLLGPLLSRLHKAVISYPGGCDIGNRPIDLHISGLKNLNVKIEERHGYIICDGKNMKAGEVHLDFPSVGATENIMMACVKLKGKSVIYNAAKEPEIVDLQNFINSMGGKISGAGTSTIIIQGVDQLSFTEYEPIADRIVAGTYLIAGAITGGHIKLNNAIPEHNIALISKLKQMGCDVLSHSNSIELIANGRLNSCVIDTQPYPGFPTDLQSQMLALQTICNGTGVVIENLFETRFKTFSELSKMGADITIRDRVALIRGVEKLYGATVSAGDLRGGASLVLAGLKAEGYTTIDNIYHIDRGYDNLEYDLKSLGANIKRIKN